MAKSKAAEKIEEEADSLHPKLREHLIGFSAQEKQLLAMINGKSLPHALLITGQRGIGKATLAYRVARFLLSPQEEATDSLFGDSLPPESLHIAHTHPTFKRVASGGHPDLLVLDGDDIKVEAARLVPEFLSLTPAESKWRVVIIDSVDVMNRNAANALLKILEEPPAQAVLLLISHNPGALLPTIRSRCRTFRMPKLGEQDFAKILQEIAPEVEMYDYHQWGVLSGYSPGIALTLIENKADSLYKEILELVHAPETLKLHTFADRFARKENERNWKTFTYLVQWLISRIVACGAAEVVEIFPGENQILKRLHLAKPLDTWTELWEKTGNLFYDTEHLHLDRKQAIITLIRAISE